MSEPQRNISRRTILKGAAWSVPIVATSATAPVLAASGAGCHVFDMWSSNGRQVINNNEDQISGSIRYSPNDHQNCAEQNAPLESPFNITVTVMLGPTIYTGGFRYSGNGSATQSGHTVIISLPYGNMRPGFYHQWNLYAKVYEGVTKEQARWKATIVASNPRATWKIIESHNEWMQNRTGNSYQY